ncbi:hypothetical protein [Nostoc phage YongM]|nr:hypothetical protein [Nostoc phage YongM]
MEKIAPLSIRREAIEKLVIYNIDAKEALKNRKVPDSNVNLVRKVIERNNMIVSKFIQDVTFASELN